MKLSFAAIGLASLVAFTACDGASSDDAELIGGLVVAQSRAIPHAVPSAAVVAMGERWIGYLASETEGSEDLNLDADTLDLVAVAFDTNSRDEFPLAAAFDVHILGTNFYLLVREAEDSKDWSGDADTDDDVLLHWSPSTNNLVFLARLGRDEVLVTEDRLFFTLDPDGPLAPNESTLATIGLSDPLTVVGVSTVGAGTGVDPEVFAEDEGLLFLLQDETEEGFDFNADGDQADESVLALLDTTQTNAAIRSVGLAVEDSSPVRANRLTTGDWLVAFLVSEDAQGALNLNHPALFGVGWQPTHCIGFNDIDALDEVVFFLRFNDWFASPGASPPVNTGLVGDDRVFVIERSSEGRYVVGTISDEKDEGTCALNGDGDQADDILRWGEVIGNTFSPHVEVGNMVAIADVPGGTQGVAEVSGRIVAVLSESDDARDWDGDVEERDLLAWIDPFDGNGASWTVPMRSSSAVPLGVSWFAQQESKGAFLFGDQEEVLGRPCNTGDSDEDDSFPVVGRFNPANPEEIQWDGYCYAAETFNPGMVLEGRRAFFRASESEQGRDINEDGDRADMVLLRHDVFPLERLFFIDTHNNLPGPAVFVGPGGNFAFLVDEAMVGQDRNGDGDAVDYVLRYVVKD